MARDARYWVGQGLHVVGIAAMGFCTILLAMGAERVAARAFGSGDAATWPLIFQAAGLVGMLCGGVGVIAVAIDALSRRADDGKTPE